MIIILYEIGRSIAIATAYWGNRKWKLFEVMSCRACKNRGHKVARLLVTRCKINNEVMFSSRFFCLLNAIQLLVSQFL